MLQVLVPRIDRRMKALSLTANGVSTKIGKDRNYIGQLHKAMRGERGAFYPKSDVLQRLSMELKCSIDYLEGRSESPGAPEPAGAVDAAAFEFAVSSSVEISRELREEPDPRLVARAALRAYRIVMDGDLMNLSPADRARALKASLKHLFPDLSRESA